jgi:hypothetical protein
MTENPRFRKFALPDLDDSQESYAKWTANPVVSAIKSALTTLGRRDQGLREQLLSLVSGYPKSWLQNHLGVGRVLVNNAIDLASSVGPGMHPAVVKKLERDRRTRKKEEFLLKWMERKENSESSPEIRRDHSGQLMQQTTTYRVINQYNGYKKYCSDSTKDGFPHYSRAHFYLRNKEMGLIDSKSVAGRVLQVSVRIVIATVPRLGRAWRCVSS